MLFICKNPSDSCIGSLLGYIPAHSSLCIPLWSSPKWILIFLFVPLKSFAFIYVQKLAERERGLIKNYSHFLLFCKFVDKFRIMFHAVSRSFPFFSFFFSDMFCVCCWHASHVSGMRALNFDKPLWHELVNVVHNVALKSQAAYKLATHFAAEYYASLKKFQLSGI